MYRMENELARSKKREIAEYLYMTSDKTQKEICETVGWSENTFSKNKEKYKWEEMRGAQSAGVHKIITNIHLSIAKMTEEDCIKNAKDILMLSRTIEILRGSRLTISNYIDVFKEFTSFLLMHDAKTAQAFNAHQKAFLEEKLKGGKE